MQCMEARRFVPAYLDGELDLTKSIEIETHIADCQMCQSFFESEKALKNAFRASSLYFNVPPDLQTRIMKSLPQENRSAVVSRKQAKRGWQNYGAAAALLLFLVFVIYRFTFPLQTFSWAQTDSLAQEVLSSHIRSLMAEHLYDVRSTDKHTVKPWFDGKIDYAPDVEELKAAGFPLVGGRLDYLNNRPVAALVYQRQKHTINLYIWPASREPDSEMKLTTLRGYNLWHWTKSETNFWAVSDLNSGELREFASEYQNQSTPVK